MKELSIEEKARRYDEAIEKAKKLYEQGTITESLSYVFPELKESEDERIRKALISFLKSPFVNENITDEKVTPWIAWLEKQGEQKPAFEMKTPEESLGIDSDTYNKIVDECIYGEQKPAEWIQELESKLSNATPEQLAEWKEKYFKVEPAWSEEDEKHFSWLIEYLNQSAGLYDNLIDWLKSLKERYTWKPSDEQMTALKGVQEGIFRLGILESLYQDLKKLREE